MESIPSTSTAPMAALATYFRVASRGSWSSGKSDLLQLARYVVLNPVRAHRVRRPEEWSWSSYRATAGLESALPLLATEWLLGAFAETRELAVAGHRRFVGGASGPPVLGPRGPACGQRHRQGRARAQDRSFTRVSESRRPAPSASCSQLSASSIEAAAAVGSILPSGGASSLFPSR